MDPSVMSSKSRDPGDAGKTSPRENATGEKALYVFNRLIRMATENELSTWKQNQVRKFLRHNEIEEIFELSDDFGRSVLDNACIAGNLRLVQLLLPKGAKMRKIQVTMALVCSHVRILDTLLADNPELAKTKVVLGSDTTDTTETMPLLNYCAKIGNERALSILFKHNFSDPESIVMSLDSVGNTPLHMAQKEEVAALLLNRVVDIKAVLKITNRKGQMPVHSVMERFNATQRSINFGINSEELQLESSFLEKTIVLYNRLSSQFSTSEPNPSSGHLSINTDGRQVAAETMQSILQRRYSQIQQPHRGNMPKPYSDHNYLSAVAARRRVLQQQQQQGGRFSSQKEHQRHNIAGASATIQQQQQLYESSAYHRQSRIVGAPASMESIKNQLAMERQERYNDTALALSEYAREWDPRREQQQQQQQLHNQQDYMSGLKIGNSSWKEAAAAAMVGGTPSSARIFPHLNSHVPSIPADSFRLTLSGMRPASPLAASAAHSTLRQISPGDTSGSQTSARISGRPALGNEQEQQQQIYMQQQRQNFFSPS